MSAQRLLLNGPLHVLERIPEGRLKERAHVCRQLRLLLLLLMFGRSLLLFEEAGLTLVPLLAAATFLAAGLAAAGR